MPPRKRLGQLLVEMKIIDEHQLQSALGHQKQWGGKLGGILVQKGFCREEQVVAALSEHLSMPAVRLSNAKIDPRAVKMVSKSVAERLHVFAYEVSGSGRSELITIAMSDPTDLSAIDQLAFHTGKRIKPMLAGDSEVLAFIQQHYAPDKPADQAGKPTPAAGVRPFVDGAKAGAMARPTPAGPMSAVAAPRLTPVAPMPTVPAGFTAPTPPAPPPPPQPPEQFAADGSDQAAAPVEPLAIEGGDLPADAPMDGLEPIAAHTQGDTSIQGAEGVAAPDATGSSDEPVPLEDPAALQGWAEGTQQEGVPLETANPVAPPAPPESGWSEAPQGPDSGWPAAPVPAATGWTEPSVAAVGAQHPDELPIDAIIGTADVLEQSADDAPVPGDETQSAVDDSPVVAEASSNVDDAQAADAAASLDAPDAWSDISDPLAGGGGAEAEASEGSHDDGAAADDGAPQSDAQDGANSDGAWEAAAAAVEAAAEEERRSDDRDEAAQDAGEAQSASEAEGSDSLLAPPDDAPAPLDDSPVPVDEVSIDTEGWSDDATVPAPADEGAAFSMSSPADEAQGEEEPDASFDVDTQESDESGRSIDEERPATQRYGWVLRHNQQRDESGDTGSGGGSDYEQQDGYEEQPAYGEDQSAQYGEEARDESEPGEGWTAPTEPDAQSGAWFGDALSSTTPLSPADLGTLTALGLDPADGAAAQRMLACLVRVLNRRQAIDLEELAAEIRESQMAAETQVATEEQPPPDDTPADPDTSAEPADDPA